MTITKIPIPFSATRIDILQSCLRKYYYEYVNPDKKSDVIDTDLLLGLFFHKWAELLWTGNPGNLRHKYKSRLSYTNAAKAYFINFITKKDSFQGRKIEWAFEGQKWVLIHRDKEKELESKIAKQDLPHKKDGEIIKILRMYYDLTLQEPPPFAVEVPFKIMVDGKIYVGRIDEIRKKGDSELVIRDHKYYPYKTPKDMERNFNPQFTVYAFALTADLREHGEISNMLGFSKENARKMAGEKIISENISLEYHLFNQNMILPATRIPEHYKDISDTIAGLEDKLLYASETGNFYAQRGRHCDYCLHKARCKEETLAAGNDTMVPVQIEMFQIDRKFARKRHSKYQLRIQFPRLKKVV